MQLREAQRLAIEVQEYMSPHCERVYIAGSIRRSSPEVKDIELVCIPRWQEKPDPAYSGLFPRTYNANLLFEAMQFTSFIQWIKPGTKDIINWAIKPDGKYWRGLIREGSFKAPIVTDIKLDLFLARPTNWGVIYTIRTGSADFSRALVTHARDNTDYRVDEGELKYKGEVVECPDEQTLFASLNLEWIEPRARGGERDLVTLH